MQSTVALSIASATPEMRQQSEDRVDGLRMSVAREVREDSVLVDDSNSDSSDEDNIHQQRFVDADFEDDDSAFDPEFHPDMDFEEDSGSDSSSVAPRKRTAKKTANPKSEAKTAAPVAKRTTRSASKR